MSTTYEKKTNENVYRQENTIRVDVFLFSMCKIVNELLVKRIIWFETVPKAMLQHLDVVSSPQDKTCLFRKIDSVFRLKNTTFEHEHRMKSIFK